MKLKCPRCNTSTSDIGDRSRFETFQCDSCDHRFLGIQADIATFDFWLKQVISLRPDFPFRNCTHCLWCGHLCWLRKVSRGYVGPSVCGRCGGKLPEHGDVVPTFLTPNEFADLVNDIRSKEMDPVQAQEFTELLDKGHWRPGEMDRLLVEITLAVDRWANHQPSQ